MKKRSPENLTTSTVALVLGGLTLVLALSFCGGDSTPKEIPPPTGPIVVIGTDGLEWDLVLHLVQAGRMPHLERLMNRGSYGLLKTYVPTASPVLWTTMATGKEPIDHGIENFAYQELGGPLQLYNRTDRKTKAIWNIVSDSGQFVHSVGWWMTFPAEEIRGVMVAQTNHVSQLEIEAAKNVWKGGLREDVPGQVYPSFMEARVMEILDKMERGELDRLLKAIFGEFPHPLKELGRRFWENCRWAFRADATYAEIATELVDAVDPEEKPVLTMVYFGGTDVVGHRFWRFMEPGRFLKSPTDAQLANFGDIIFDYYEYIDDKIGQLVEAHGPDANYFVVSDHGMRPVNLRGLFDPDDPPKIVNSGDHQEGPAGVLVAAGPAIARGALGAANKVTKDQLPKVGELLDLTPTWLAMLRIPRGEDMPGNLLEDLFTAESDIAIQPDPISTHDDDAFAEKQRLIFHDNKDQSDERLQQLRDLGYLADQ